MPARTAITTAALLMAIAAPASAAPRGGAPAMDRISDRQAADLALTQLAGRAAELGLDDVREELVLRSVGRDALGQLHVRLDQQVRGIPVFGAQIIAHLDRTGALRSITDDLTPKAGLPALRPSITPGRALRQAMGDFGQGTSEAPFVDLVLFETFEGDVDLTYQIGLTDIESDEPKEHVYFIDAHSGEIVFDYDNLHTRAVNGEGHSLYVGDVDLTVNSQTVGYEMRDPARGGNLTTDMGNGTSGNGQVFTDIDNDWGNGQSSDRATAAVDAHFGAMMTWDFMMEKLNREGIKDDGQGTLGRVHYGNGYNNAFWNDACLCMTYGDGDGRTLGPLVAIDVVAHEFTHGVTSATAGLTYFYEAGGMNEGFSDIIGTAVEFYAADRGADTDPDFEIGEDLYTPGKPGDALRYMDDPRKDGRSIDHASQMRVFTDPHYSSGVPNNVFYLAAHGGQNRTSGDRVTSPIGVEKAAVIFYQAVANYMTPRSRFTDQRDATERAAADLYGQSEVSTMSAAWSACGVK